MHLENGEVRRREFEDREYPLFRLSGDGLHICGTYPDGSVAFAERIWNGHRHYCCCLPLLRCEDYRAIFDAAGVHSYAPAGNTVYADSRFAGIFSRSAASFAPALPKRPVAECITGDLSATVQMQAHDARLYLFE